NDTRVDYDGVTQYPVKNIGYEIIITNTNVNPDPTALFVVHVNVDTNQTYYTEPSIAFPTDPIRLNASVKDSAVWALLESSTFKPTTYQDGTIGNPKRYSLKDHINSIGTGLVSANNPHGIAPKDIPTYDSAQLTNQEYVIRNGFFSSGLPSFDSYGTILNSTSSTTKYVRVAATTPPLFFNGLKYPINSLPQFNSNSGYLEIPFDVITYPTSGYYKVCIPNGATTPVFQAFPVSFLDYNGPLLYGFGDDNEIFLGYVYWDTSIPELRETNKANNVDGTKLAGFTTVGVLNKAENTSFAIAGATSGRNVLMLPDGIIDFDTNGVARNIPKCYYTWLYGGAGTATATVSYDGTMIKVTVNCTNPGEFWLYFPLAAGYAWVNIIPFFTAKFRWSLGINSTNVYRCGVKLYDVIRDMPADSNNHQIVVKSFSASQIAFFIVCQAPGTYTFNIYGLSVVEGAQIPSGALLPNHIPASQVVLNTNFAKYGPTQVVEEFRPTVANQNMDRIVYWTPQTPTMKQTSNNVQSSNANFTTYGAADDNFSNVMIDSTKMNNIEVWPVQGLMRELYGGVYDCIFNYDSSKYELISANMNWISGDYSPATPDRVKDWLRFAPAGFTYCVILADNSGAAILNKHIYCTGTMIMRRKVA
ncbi:MAG: hypothetical protein LDL38_11245, partial [Flavobacterium piscis]|nr:hypothetical protein [Flavobacterium piscis]